MSTERRWNRNEVSRESPDKEVNWRPTSLKNLEQMRWGGGARVSIATGWDIKSRGREEYLVSFLFEAVSAALPPEWDVEYRYKSTVTSHVRDLPPCHSINVSSPSGRLPLSLARPTGLLHYGDACCGYSTGNDVIDGLMPGYSTRGLLTHQAVNPLCIDERPTSTGMGDTDAAA